MGVSPMFQRERIRCRPLGRPLSVCEVVCAGWELLPLNVCTNLPSTKYSQLVVRWHAVQNHRNVAVLPILVTGQPRSSLRIENELPPLHCIEPLGASTLCGSYCTWPQSN